MNWKLLFSLLPITLLQITGATVAPNIPISGMPISTTLQTNAWIPIIQPLPGRTTNDNFRVAPSAFAAFLGTNNTSGSNVFNTIIVTNITVVTNITITTNVTIIVQGNTNLAGLWTDTLGDYTPTQADQTTLHATNIYSAQSLTSLGAFVMNPTGAAGDLVAGANNVNPFNSSMSWWNGFSQNPADSWIRLSVGNGPGQLLTVQNFGTNAFTMFNGDELWDTALQHLYLKGGDWTPTHDGETILLLKDWRGWAEIGRFGGPTNVVVQELTINPTDGTLPVRSNATTFADSSITEDATMVNIKKIAHPNSIALNDTYQMLDSNNLVLTVVHGLFDIESDDPVAANRNFTLGNGTQDNFELLLVWHSNAGILTNGGNMVLSSDWVPSSGHMLQLVWDAAGVWREQWRYPVPGANLWTNNAGILEPVNLALPVEIDSQLRFGPTNVVYRSGGSLVYSNNAGVVEFDIAGISGTTKIGINSTIGRILAPDGVDVQWTNVTAKTVRFWDHRIHPLVSGIVLGGDLSTSPITPFSDLNLDGTYYHYGYIGSGVTNYSRLAVSHTGTNGAVVFDSQSAGSGGLPRNISFQTNGVERAFIHLDSEQIGVTSTTNVTGGFMQAGTGAFSLLSDGTALVLHNSAAELQFSSNQLIPSVATMTLGGNGVPFHQVWTDQILLTGITKAQKTALTPIDGMVVYQTDNTPGIRAYVNGAWVILQTAADP